MRIFDCTTFFNENLMLEVRFNILNKYVDKFIVAEAKYSHSGEKKKLNFDIKKFPEFKKKIIYIVIDNEPENIIYQEKDNNKFEKKEDMRMNSIKRIAYQRNKIINYLDEANEEDFIFYSDNDEIPKFENLDLEKIQNKIVIFKQKLFYYKFNLYCDRVDWFGTKGCQKKKIVSFSWLREVKAKKYPFYRFDTLFSKTKYKNVSIVDDGGWHFSQLKTPKDIEIKLLNQEHHDEYRLAKKALPSIAELIKRKSIVYDHKAKSTDYKFSNEFKLKTLSMDDMPLFLKKNENKYSEWFDFEK